MNRILIIGATSTAAELTARRFAAEHCKLVLAARSMRKLAIMQADLELRGARSVSILRFDAMDYSRHKALVTDAATAMGGIDCGLLFHGVLPDQRQCEVDFDLAKESIEVNFLSHASMISHLANHFEQCRKGTLVVIGSVAGLRGRKSNYVYGAAKAAVATFAQGIRNRLAGANVRTVLILPGPFASDMTKNLREGAHWSAPQKVAKRIHSSSKSGPDIVYVPFFWRGIMAIVKAIPEVIFKKLNL